MSLSDKEEDWILLCMKDLIDYAEKNPKRFNELKEKLNDGK